MKPVMYDKLHEHDLVINAPESQIFYEVNSVVNTGSKPSAICVIHCNHSTGRSVEARLGTPNQLIITPGQTVWLLDEDEKKEHLH